MTRLLCCILLAFGLGIAPAAIVQAQGRGYDNRTAVGNETIRCESQDDRPRTCQTPWRGASQLVRQLSDSPCIEGRTRGDQGKQIWGRDGCSAVFGTR